MEQIIRFHYTVPQLLKKINNQPLLFSFFRCTFWLHHSLLISTANRTNQKGEELGHLNFFNITFGGDKAPNLASKTGPQIRLWVLQIHAIL